MLTNLVKINLMLTSTSDIACLKSKAYYSFTKSCSTHPCSNLLPSLYLVPVFIKLSPHHRAITHPT